MNEDRPADSLPVPTTDLTALQTALDDADAAGFAAVGDRFDDDLRYLTRFRGPDRDYAFVFADGEAVCCAPAGFAERAEREFDGRVRAADADDPAGVRAAAALSELGADRGTVLVPRSIPHDAAVHLERAGYDLESTTAVADARTVKTDAEIDCLRRVQRAAARGMRRAEAVLAAAAVDGDELVWRDAPLSTERLRRRVNAELAAYGVRDAGNTAVVAGAESETGAGATDPHRGGPAARRSDGADARPLGETDLLRPGETVRVGVAPRGPHGYYADLVRTFVVDSGGGWERRAYVAVEAALTAGLAEVEPGASAAAVRREVVAELTAYGFDPTADEAEGGLGDGAGHGIGVSLHERPSLREAVELRAGTVFTVEAGVSDPDRGEVRLTDAVVVTDGGFEPLQEYPRSFAPRAE